MIAAFSDWPKVFASCYENLNPGGWVEMQEYYIQFQCIDNSLAGTSLERWNNLVLEAMDKLGRNGRAARKFRSQLTAAGFVDVQERKFALPGNPWAKGEREKMLGLMQMTNALDGLHGMTMQLYTRVLGWSPEAVELFLVDVRKDVKNKDIHFYYVMYVHPPLILIRHKEILTSLCSKQIRRLWPEADGLSTDAGCFANGFPLW
jgi:hypothetical protein